MGSVESCVLLKERTRFRECVEVERFSVEKTIDYGVKD